MHLNRQTKNPKTHRCGSTFAYILSMIHSHLGKKDTINVYIAELTAMHLGINMAGVSPSQYNKGIIYVDNQASIQAPKQQSAVDNTLYPQEP